jgi:hypothetical protein
MEEQEEARKKSDGGHMFESPSGIIEATPSSISLAAIGDI